MNTISTLYMYVHYYNTIILTLDVINILIFVSHNVQNINGSNYILRKRSQLNVTTTRITDRQELDYYFLILF